MKPCEGVDTADIRAAGKRRARIGPPHKAKGSMVPVYVDDMRAPFRGRILCHMVADTLEELHAMADAVGMPRRAYQGPPKTRYPHYDIPWEFREEAVRLGAVEITMREAPGVAKRCLQAMNAQALRREDPDG